MTVKQRLIDYLKYKKIGQKKFARLVGVSDGYVNAIRVSIQPGVVHNIAMCFPDLNTGWLLTGEGEMLKSKPESTSVENEDPSTKIFLGIIETLTATNMELTMANKELVNSNTRMAQQIQEMQNILHEMEEDMETLRREFQRGLASMGSADAEAV